MSWLRRRLKGWRTVAFGLLIALVGLLDALSAEDITPRLPEGRAGSIMAIIGVVTIVLRLVTTGPLGGSAPAEPDYEDGGQP
jgi:hypothetical protein